jgi:hypothetical protein
MKASAFVSTACALGSFMRSCGIPGSDDSTASSVIRSIEPYSFRHSPTHTLSDYPSTDL